MNVDVFHRVKHRIVLYLSDIAYRSHEELQRIAAEAVRQTYSEGISNKAWAREAKEFIKNKGWK